MKLLVNKIKRKIVEDCIFPRNKDNYLISYGIIGNKLYKNPVIRDADIIHLQWISRGFLSVNELCDRGKREYGQCLICGLYGICHYSLDCEKYKVQCNNCPQWVQNIIWLKGCKNLNIVK